MRRSIVFLMCLSGVLCMLSGCAKKEADLPPAAAPQAETVTVTETAPVTEKEKADVLEPTAYSDDPSAEELLRIRFTAIQSAAAEPMEVYYPDMASGGIVLDKDGIPFDLIDALCKAIDDGTADGFIAEHRTGTELTVEEMLDTTGYDAEYVQSAMSFRADIDNDGTEDIISHIYGGGTGGFASIVLFNGSDGLRQTASVSDIYYETSVLGWNGKNYLSVEEYDYNTKQWLGYKIYAFAEGDIASITSVCKQITGYTSEIIRSASSYPGLGQITTTLSNDKMPTIVENNNGVIYGTAETPNEDMTRFSADINNDGTVESYTKYMFYPSTAGMQQRCMWNIEGFEEGSDPVADLTNSEENSDAGVLYTFWLDKVEGDNVLYLYFHGDYGFELCAYKLSA